MCSRGSSVLDLNAFPISATMNAPGYQCKHKDNIPQQYFPPSQFPCNSPCSTLSTWVSWWDRIIGGASLCGLMLRQHTGWSHWFITCRPQKLIVNAVVLDTEACLTCRKISYSSHTNPLIFSAVQLSEMWDENPFHIHSRNCPPTEVQNPLEKFAKKIQVEKWLFLCWQVSDFQNVVLTAQSSLPPRIEVYWTLTLWPWKWTFK